MTGYEYDKHTAIDPKTVKVGDRVIPQNYRETGLPTALKNLGETTVTWVGGRTENCEVVHGTLIEVEGSSAKYGYEWFRPAERETYLLVDGSEVEGARYWLYSEANDRWEPFYLAKDTEDGRDDRPEDWADLDFQSQGGAPWQGFDEGAEEIANRFGIEVGSADPEPTVLQASLTHETSRQYARNATSARSLTSEQNAILNAAADGKEIDVVAFRKAATAALSLASTRAGQSMGRRVFAKEARHLIYWADAIIDNHIKGLPAYETGERSPKIARLQADLDHVIEEHRKVEEAAAQSNRDLLKLQSVAAEAQKQIDALLKDREEGIRNLAEARRDRDIAGDVIEVIVERLETSDKGFALGYWQGRLDSE